MTNVRTDFIDGTKNPNDMCEFIEFAYTRFKVLNVAIGWDRGHERERAYITYEYNFGDVDLHTLISDMYNEKYKEVLEDDK